MENEQAKFEGWAIVEMMGRQQEIGFVTTEAYGVAVLFRVDVPEIPEHDFILKRPEYGSIRDGRCQYLPPGTKVKRPGVLARSRLISPAAVYAINPCSEAAAKAAMENNARRTLICIELPQPKSLPEGEAAAAEAAEENDEDERSCQECGQTPEEGHAEGCSCFIEEEEDDAM
jgi:hypothetical protein